MLKHAEIYLHIRETYPAINWDSAIAQAFMDSLITLELCYELLEIYYKVQRGEAT